MFKNKDGMLGLLRSAIDNYGMIEEGDRIAIGLSGGKDSVALLCLLYELQQFYPKRFSIIALTIDPGFAKSDYTELVSLCESMNIEHVLSKQPFGKILFEIRKEKRPCSLCAKLRRGCLHSIAIEHECNKIALGHHHDDAAETFLMNILNGGNARCFSPVTYMSRKNIHVIRPLIFAPEHEVALFVKENELPTVKSACPVDGKTERARIKELISQLSKEYAKLPQKLVGALQRGDISDWGLGKKKIEE